MSKARVAVIGTGLAGAACARALRAGGMKPVVFDKGRGAGGRLATRRSDTPAGQARFDHGAQYLTAKGEAFAAFLSEARAAGAAAPWEGRLVSIDRGGNVAPLKAADRWVGAPGMSAIARYALEGIETRQARRARKLVGGPDAWRVRFDDGEEAGPFAAVALTVPPEQLVDLLALTDGDFAEMIVQARGAVMAPCQAVMAVLPEPFDPGFDGAKIHGGSISWMGRNTSKPGREGPESWVIHARPDWSRAHLEDEPDDVARALIEEAYIRFGLPVPAWSAAHRWRYALSEAAPGSAFALDATGTVGCGGDWRLGPRGELAFDSGLALGRELAERLG